MPRGDFRRRESKKPKKKSGKKDSVPLSEISSATVEVRGKRKKS